RLARRGCSRLRDRTKRTAVTAMPAESALSLDLDNEAATAALAARLAPLARRGDLIALRGELGSGKTSFARAFIPALGLRDAEVPSRPVTLVEVYEFPDHPPVWHFDLYRLRKPEEVHELGFEEALGQAIVLMEWPERLGALLPRERLDLELCAGDAPE